jgi:GNAT superfamily N-acetyltransferase
VISFREFRNGDPPAIRDLWNLHSLQSRGCGYLAGCDHLEHYLFSKPYFDRAGFHLAFDDDRLVGMALAGFGGDDRSNRVDKLAGVLSLMAVHPDHRRKGIGGELLRRTQQYLRAGGAGMLFAGGTHPLNPYGIGVYGGSDSPGILDSDPGLVNFLVKRGYKPIDSCQVLQLSLRTPLGRLADPRLPLLRRQVKIFSEPFPTPFSWWHNCTMGPTITYRYEMLDAETEEQIGSSLVWEMETFTRAWKSPVIGLSGISIDPERRRRGYGALLLHSVLKHLQDNRIALVEAQVMEQNLPARQLFAKLNFERVDVGRMYRWEP